MRRVLFLLLIALTPLCGCSGDSKSERQAKESKETTSSSTAKLDTPEAAYLALASAADKEDWQAAASILTRESQAMMTAGMIIERQLHDHG